MPKYLFSPVFIREGIKATAGGRERGESEINTDLLERCEVQNMDGQQQMKINT